MPYEITIDAERGYLNLHYFGAVRLDDRKSARDEVFALCREHNIAHSLVETQDSDIMMNESDVIRFAAGFENIDLPPNYRLACVVSPDNSGDKLLEIIISLEGINVKYFLRRDEALNWLQAV